MRTFLLSLKKPLASTSTFGLSSLSQALRGGGRTICSGPRRLSNSGDWKNESPPGGLTEVYVFYPSSTSVWPDPNLGVFSPVDPRFVLPGGAGIEDSLTSEEGKQSDIFTSQTNMERQSQTMFSAKDFIHHTKDSENVVCADILQQFPKLSGTSNLCCEVHEAPHLLKKETQGLFPDRELQSGRPLTVLTLAQKTENDMSMWSDNMEEEREKLMEDFVSAAKEICARLQNEGYWADFIDPSSGTPYYGSHTNVTMFETDEKFRLLGFRIEDLGCCKVISHRDFGRNVFVGTIFSDVGTASGVVQDMFQELSLEMKKVNNVE